MLQFRDVILEFFYSTNLQIPPETFKEQLLSVYLRKLSFLSQCPKFLLIISLRDISSSLTLLTFVLRTNDPKFEQFPFRIGGQVELSIVSSLSPRLDRKSIEIRTLPDSHNHLSIVGNRCINIVRRQFPIYVFWLGAVLGSAGMRYR